MFCTCAAISADAKDSRKRDARAYAVFLRHLALQHYGQCIWECSAPAGELIVFKMPVKAERRRYRGRGYGKDEILGAALNHDEPSLITDTYCVFLNV